MDHRLRVRALLLCVSVTVVQPDSMLAQSTDIFGDSETQAVLAAALSVRLEKEGRRQDGVALLQETRPVTGCPDEKLLPPEWRAVLASHERENASMESREDVSPEIE